MNNRSSLTVRARSHSIVKKLPFGRQRSSMFHRRGVDQGGNMTRLLFRGQRRPASNLFRSAPCSVFVWQSKRFGFSSLGHTRSGVGMGPPDTLSSTDHPMDLLTFTFWTVLSAVCTSSHQPTATADMSSRTSTTVICTYV